MMSRNKPALAAGAWSFDMDEKFTPGPWRRWGLPFIDSIEVRTECLDTTVAILDGSCWNANANSRLITAAPDMYAALNRMCRNAIELGHCVVADCHDCPTMAVLKKARGEI